MSYISNIFERAHLQQLSEFLLTGVDALEVSEKSYEERLKDARTEALEKIQEYFPDDSEEMENRLLHIVWVYEKVYMEIGIQVGMTLSAQLFGHRN